MIVDEEAGKAEPSEFVNMEHLHTVDEGAEEIVVNLHPDYLVRADRLHDPTYFPFVEQAMALGIRSLKPAFGRLNSLAVQWPNVRRVLPLYLNRQIDLFIPSAEQLIGTPSPKRSLRLAAANEQFWEILHYLFLLLMTRDMAGRLRRVEHLTRRLLKLRRAALREYRTYVVQNHERHFTQIAWEAAASFFDDLDLFRPLVVTRICGKKLSICGEPPQLSGTSFDRVRYLYGNLFERAGDLCLHFAAINNIKRRGAYWQFASWTLERYLESDKASRLTPFEEEPTFHDVIAPHYDNGLRNASHHGKMTYEPTNGTVTYWPKRGTTRSRTALHMPVWQYLEKCYDLILAVGVLVSLHYGLDALLPEVELSS